MTYRSALEYGRQYLEEKGIPDASVDAWYLLEFSCGLDRTRYLLGMMDPMQEEEVSRYQGLLEKRGSRIPLQHISQGIPEDLADLLDIQKGRAAGVSFQIAQITYG